MVGTVENSNLNVNYRIAAQDTGLHSFLNTCIDRSNELLRDASADCLVNELITLTGLLRFESEPAVTVLTVTTGLTYELTLSFNSSSDRLFVGYLRCAYISLNLELTEQTVNDDIEVKLTHTCDDCLACFLVGICTERRVFFCELLESDKHLLL